MKIYKVCGNYLKGVQEFEIKKINPDNTFIYEKDIFGKTRIICRVNRSSNVAITPNVEILPMVGHCTTNVE